MLLSPDTLEDAGPPAAILMAVAIVGAGLLAIATFLYGIDLGQTEATRGHIIAIAGLVAYLAVWAWGI